MNEQDQIKKESNTLDVNKDVVKENANTDTRYRFKAAAFLSVIGAFGFLTGFGGALAAVKKQDPSSFDQGLTPTNSIHKVGKPQCSDFPSGLNLTNIGPYGNKENVY